jgi:Protein of unknown function (DUF3126)
LRFPAIGATQARFHSNQEALMDKNDCARLERYLRRLFRNTEIRVTPRPRKTDSAELYIGEEFIGVLFEDNDEGERSFNLQIAILNEDLDE